MGYDAPFQDKYDQGGRTWQPFVGGKNGHENLKARIYNFRDNTSLLRVIANLRFNSVKYAIYTI